MTRICGFVLAAGEGRRMRPATLVCPKALLPFCGVPLLELAVAELRALPGVEQVVVNACFMREKVVAACAELSRCYDWDIRCSQEEKLLNHGGGLRKGVAELAPDADEILVHNVDIVHDNDLRKLIERHHETGADVTVLLIPNHRANGVLLDTDDRILSFRDPHGDLTFSGLYLFKKDILDFLPPDQEAPSILDAFLRAAAAGRRICGMVANPRLFWSDVGTAQEYIRAHGAIADCALVSQPHLREAQVVQSRRRFELESQGVKCTGAIGLGEEVAVAPGAHLHNVVLWDHTRIEAPLLYADGILTGGTVKAPPTTGAAERPDPRILASFDLDADGLSMEALPKQGSGRHYYRIPDPAKHRTLVWSSYNPRRRENASFAAISDFLARLGIRVPRVLLHLADANEMVTEDLGQNDLLLEKSVARRDYLLQVVEQVARLHVLGAVAVRLEELPLQPGFTKGLYDWERDYFRENLLGRVLHCPEVWSDVAYEYCRLRTLLLQEPLVPIHRDLQSANVKVLDGKVFLIDFQGMRLGAAAYDMASLLYDPYQHYTADFRLEAWWEYCHQVRMLGGTPPADAVFHAAAIQRLMQALGAYGKLWLKDHLEWYRQFILPALRHLLEAAQASPLFPNFRTLAEHALAKCAEQGLREE
ncbi:MAG: NTP transferase domain-containing protein [Victivallales bacterium]|nr:NTP transferase domain-containing protein [Victivallales bacterium]